MASIITDGVSVMKQHSRVTLTVIECRVLKGHRLAGKDVAFAKIYTSNQLLIRVIDQSDCPFPSDSSFALARPHAAGRFRQKSSLILRKTQREFARTGMAWHRSDTFIMHLSICRSKSICCVLSPRCQEEVKPFYK